MGELRTHIVHISMIKLAVTLPKHVWDLPLVRWACALSFSALVTALMLLPRESALVTNTSALAGGTDATDSVGHVMIFAFVAILYYRALSVHFTARLNLISAVIIALAFGTFTEVGQHFVAHRGSNIFDLIANWFGVSTFALWMWKRVGSK
jgi:VanZ family protein